MDTSALHNMDSPRNVSESLSELKLTPVLLLPGAESSFPKILSDRPCSTVQQGLILLFRRHSEDSKSL